MVQALRAVKRLRLRAPSEALVRSAARALEDALRTASLPDTGARLLLVRELALGRIAGGASPQSIALVLEARFAELGVELMHAAEPGAAQARAVWFRDALEAHCLAALRLAAGEPLDAWFWPLALPVLREAPGVSAGLRALAFSLAAHEEAPAALPQWVAALVHAGHGERLLAALDADDMDTLLRAVGLAPLSDAQESNEFAHAHLPSISVGARAGGSGSAGAVAVSETHDNGRVFLRAMLRRAGVPDFVLASARRKEASVQSKAAGALLRRAASAPSERAEHPAVASAGDVKGASPPTHPLPVASGETPGRHAVVSHEALGARDWRASAIAEPSGPLATSQALETITHQPGPRSAWRWAHGQPTCAGGLLFLVPVLERLGFGTWWETNPHAQAAPPGHLASCLFARLLARLHIAEDDSMWALATPRFTADASGAEAQAAGWLSSCRRHLRRVIGIGPASLVLRPARIAITPTHADVFFDLDAADLRVRRAGLDVDPGWVPWLARVVAFHYGSADELP